MVMNIYLKRTWNVIIEMNEADMDRDSDLDTDMDTDTNANTGTS